MNRKQVGVLLYLRDTLRLSQNIAHAIFKLKVYFLQLTSMFKIYGVCVI